MSQSSPPNPGGGPLDGLRVIEMGTLLAGPFCGQLMGDLGAEVIKIENPDGGDVMRGWGHEKPNGRSLWWPIVARNKKSVTLNLREVAGQEAAKALIDSADFVVENFRPGTLERWGLGYETMAARNPGIIYIRVTGFGQYGPKSPQAGYGSIGEAMGGLRYIVGDPDKPPSRVGISIGDSLAGTIGALGGVSALHERERSGEGQVVDSAIYEAVLAYMESMIPEYDTMGYIRERTGAILPKVAPSNVYPCADGDSVLIAANGDTVFKRLAGTIGTPEVNSEKFSSHSGRGENQEELDQLIASWTLRQDADNLLAELERSGVPAGKIYRAPDMLEDSHFKARESIIEVEAPGLGALKMQNVVPKLSRTPGAVRWTGPELGEHNVEILSGELGLSDAEIQKATARKDAS